MGESGGGFSRWPLEVPGFTIFAKFGWAKHRRFPARNSDLTNNHRTIFPEHRSNPRQKEPAEFACRVYDWRLQAGAIPRSWH